MISPSAPLLAGELRRAGLRARTGHDRHRRPPGPAGPARALAARAARWPSDMESAPLLAGGGRPPRGGAPGHLGHPAAPADEPVGGARRASPRCGRCGWPRRCWPAGRRPAAPRQVLLAGPRSFCAGVERAIEIVERVLEQHGPPVYVRKQIVHNTVVVTDLEGRGAIFVDELDEVPDGATVVFSAHGVSPEVRQRRRRPRAARDRRDLPAGVQGARGGAPVRRRRLPGGAHRARRARGGRGHARRGAAGHDAGRDHRRRGQPASPGTRRRSRS